MFDIHQQYYDADFGEVDFRKLERYTDGLMKAFSESPEAKPLLEEDSLGWVAMVIEYAATYIGVTVPTMSKRDLDEILFEIFPRKVSTEAESAGSIIAEMRAFWYFVQREYGLGNAAGMLALLGKDAEANLRKKLSDPRNFGMAKSFFMQGQQAGFDMTTEKGAQKFMQAYNLTHGGLPLPGGDMDDYDDPYLLPLPGPPGPGRDKDKLRKARKAQRQAKKRNRKR